MERWDEVSTGFIDADEFVVLTEAGQAPSLPALLQQHERHAGLALHWQLFGSGGLMERPPGGVLASYTHCWPQAKPVHRHVKSFVQPRLVVRPSDPHSFVYRRGQGAVNTAGRRVEGPILKAGQVSYQGAVVHHYASRSLADFRVKSLRGDGAGGVKSLDSFLMWHRGSTRTCTRAVPLGLALGRQYVLRRNVPQRCMGPAGTSAGEVEGGGGGGIDGSGGSAGSSTGSSEPGD